MIKHLLVETPTLTYYRTITKNNINFEIYDNNKNDCACLVWLDPNTQEINQKNCYTNIYAEINNIIEKLNNINVE